MYARKKSVTDLTMLDVGCGCNAFGDVNVDLYVDDTEHRSGWIKGKINPKTTPNFINATCYMLPFPDNSFEVVYSRNTIEHVKDPFRMLKEMVRVSKDKIIIGCPHRYVAKHISPMHISFLNITWFVKAFQKLGLYAINCYYSEFAKYPHFMFPLIQIPEQITCSARKLTK